MSIQAPQAIQTHYAGHMFRSRLEARWAVFFDALKIEWQYEPQGFTGHRASRYLPDFYLPLCDVWVEVKGSQSQLDADIARMVELCDWGSPLSGVHESYHNERGGLLILGPIPNPKFDETPLHALLRHRSGVCAVPAFFGSPLIAPPEHAIQAWQQPSGCAWWVWPGMTWAKAIDLDEETGRPVSRGDNYISFLGDERVKFDSAMQGIGRANEMRRLLKVSLAYQAARFARFEHGARGAL